MALKKKTFHLFRFLGNPTTIDQDRRDMGAGREEEFSEKAKR